MHFKFRGAINILIICLSTTACGSGEPENPNVAFPTLEISQANSSASPNGLCNNNLNPVIQNATWIYTSVGGPGGSFNYTNSISLFKQMDLLSPHNFPTTPAHNNGPVNLTD